MVSLPESRNPDSDVVRSACVQIFQKRDGGTTPACKILERGVDRVLRDRLCMQGEGMDP